MQDEKQKQLEKAEALQELKEDVVELASMVAGRVKEDAKVVVGNVIHTVRSKTNEYLHVNQFRAQVRANPKAALAAAFGIGTAIGLTGIKSFRTPLIAAVGIGFEILKRSARDAATTAAQSAAQSYFKRSPIQPNPDSTYH